MPFWKILLPLSLALSTCGRRIRAPIMPNYGARDQQPCFSLPTRVHWPRFRGSYGTFRSIATPRFQFKRQSCQSLPQRGKHHGNVPFGFIAVGSACVMTVFFANRALKFVGSVPAEETGISCQEPGAGEPSDEAWSRWGARIPPLVSPPADKGISVTFQIPSP